MTLKHLKCYGVPHPALLFLFTSLYKACNATSLSRFQRDAVVEFSICVTITMDPYHSSFEQEQTWGKIPGPPNWFWLRGQDSWRGLHEMVVEPTPHGQPYFALGMVHMPPNGGDGWEAGWELWSSTGSMKRVSREAAGSTLIHLISLPTQLAQCLKEHNGQPQLYGLLGLFDPVRRHVSNIAWLKVTLWCL